MTLIIPDLIAACKTAEDFCLLDNVTENEADMFGPSNEPQDKPQEEQEIKVEVKAEVGGGNGK